MEEPVIINQQSQSKLHPLLEMLPEHLKDTRNYFKIKKELLKTLATKCSHDSIAKMAECKKCSDKMMERRLLLKRLGFKNPVQYQAWQKIHEQIISLYPEMAFDDGTYAKKKYIKT